MGAMTIADLTRRLENLIRSGTIAQVDLDRARCRVKTGGLLTGWLPWFVSRAGATKDWDPPTEGEQCTVFSPSGNPALGFVLVGIYSDANPAPSNSDTLCRRTYPDGAVIDYDHASHTLSATLPDGGTANLIAPGGVQIQGDVAITGQVTVTEDVVAGGISLIHHRHPGIQPGGGQTGEPV
ncbi:phage baseplate assembly protein V [Pseudomonas sp. BN415]|nr:phage baseplate assembly protein V [Pseudomonas sp. BN415]